MNIKHSAIAFMLLPLLLACEQQGEFVPESAPVLEFGSETVSAPAAETNITVAVNSNCAWTASSSESWITVSPLTGTRATRTITLTIAENTTQELSRSGQVTLTGDGVTATLNVNQSAPAGPVPPGTELYTADDFKEFLALAKDFTTGDATTVFNDIDLGGATISPVAEYAGILNGQDHKIYNFKVESASETAGLFLMNKGTIKNIVFGSADGSKYDGVSQIAAEDGKGGSSTGLVAINAGTIENVTTFATIKFVANENAAAKFGIGGLVGTATIGEESASVIRNCTNKASIMASGTLVQETSIGGVVGYVSSAGTTMESCTNDADLGINIPVKKVLMIGGVLGRTDAGGTFDKLTNNGEVSYTQEEKPSTWMSIAGVVGADYKGGVISNAVNNGAVSSNLLQVNRMGGILGVMNTGGTVSGSVNNASVTLNQGEANGNWQAVAGIVGFQEKSASELDNVITDNTNNGAVSAYIENTTTHANKVAVGGIIGEGCLQLKITNNTNIGAITANNKAAGTVYAGGIYGALIKNSATIEASGNVNAGKVTAVTSDNAAAYAGGAVGYLAAASGGDANKVTLTLTNDKNTGDVTGGPSTSGSIAGFNGNGKLVDSQVGGTVNGKTVTASNMAALIQGTSSAGTYENPTALNGGVVEGNGIKSVEDFKAFLTATDYSQWSEEGVVRILADIDASSIESLQIPAIAAGVVIDGYDHNIYNIKTVSQGANSGMILENNGTIKNLNFGTKDGLTYDGVSSISAVEGKGGDFNGLVAVNNGTLENIKTFVTVNYVAGTSAAETGVGGLVGKAGANSVIKECVNKATLNLTGAPNMVVNIGGVVGFLPDEGAQVLKCSNEAPLKVTMAIKKVLHIGGVAGRSNAVFTLEDCTNNAPVSFEQETAPSTWSSIGGVIGSVYIGGTVSNCRNKGTVSSNSQQVVRLGGIVGVLNTGGSILNSTNEGALSLTQTANANWQSVGGILGFQEKSGTNDKDNIISGNTNKGNITVSLENTTTHANKVGVGGIIGEACLALSVTNNTNTGAVKVTNAAAGAVWAGGIYGALIKNKQDITSTGNINTGSVTASTSDNAAAAAGGVIGYIAGASGGDANTVTLVLKTEKNTGAVTCANAEAVGSIAGNNVSGSLESCIAGGSVNGTAVTEANLATMVQGSGSKGTATGTTLAK